MKLTPSQQEVLESLKRHGTLLKYSGGFWSAPGVELKRLGGGGPEGDSMIPVWSFGTNTIKAMLRKGTIVATDHKTWEGKEYPVEVKLAPGC